MKSNLIFLITTLVLFSACNSTKENSESTESDGSTPVTITHATIGKISDFVELNATSTFLLKTLVKADVNGYLQKVNIQLGQKVNKGDELFVIKSKEAKHLGSSLNGIDSILKNSGVVSIVSPVNGYITQLNYSANDYVQDGEAIASISDLNSMVFLLELPYELKPGLSKNKDVELQLPDGQVIKGSLASSFPIMNEGSQTLSMVIKILNTYNLPENLVAKVKFIKESKTNAIVVPKDAILTNEAQNEFWIMKLIDSTTAIKVPITKGLETYDSVEVLAPKLQIDDKILLTGNYGLPDTAKVAIEINQ